MSYLSGYQLMWVLVMFDLPVKNPADQKAATSFRHTLLDMGFEMAQFSVYMRFCSGKGQVESYIKRVEACLPEGGQVDILTFTDKQYESIVSFKQGQREPDHENPTQIALF